MDFRLLAASFARRSFGWVPEILTLSRKRIQAQVRLLGLATLVGIVAGLGAIAFYLATRGVEHYALGVLVGYQPEPHPAGEPAISWPTAVNHSFSAWLLLIVPTVGGLLSGFLVFIFAPEAEGHGTDSVIEAYHHHQGQIRPRVPLVKMIASALTLGTGGSGGREGPIAQIGAGFGSLLGNLLRLRPAERRVLMAAGMGAGIAAIFRAPLAGTMFAAEVLYSSPEFESEVIIPAGFASVVAYCVFGTYSGWEPLFAIPDLTFTNPWQLGPYMLLAIFMVLLAMLYTRSFYGIKAWFDRMSMPRRFRPALGALLTAIVGLLLYFIAGRQEQVLAVLAFGYSAIQNAMTQDVHVSAAILLLIALGKILTTSLTIGSGGSGGVFGPSMVIGGCGGGALGIVLHKPVALAGAPSCQLRDRRHGRVFCRRRQNAVLHTPDRQRNDGRIPSPVALALGLRVVLYLVRQTVDLRLAGRRPLPLPGPSRQLRATSTGRGANRDFSLPGPGCSCSSPQRSTPPRSRIPQYGGNPGPPCGRWRQPAPGRGRSGGSLSRLATPLRALACLGGRSHAKRRSTAGSHGHAGPSLGTLRGE